ncbi:MAG: hypothetical protein LBT48_01085 [Prevotellaceae bacterium]|jgi:hypothetical protein|nr:hypothetical protein [Prevotellaceae bacterium]
MKNVLFYSFAVLAALACMISMQHCEDSPDTKVEEPFNPPAADTCGWNWDVVPTDTVISVRSEEALLSCLVCEDGNVPPAIDFDKQMVLLAHGTVQGEIVQVTYALTESSGFYTFNVRVKIAKAQTQSTKAGITTSAVESGSNDWAIVEIIDKINAKPQLHLTVDDFPIGYYCDIMLPSIIEWTNMERPADAYNYPAYPCMDEWGEIEGGYMGQRDACQIPEDIVKNMSTQALIQAFWEYPFFSLLPGGLRADHKTAIEDLDKYFSTAYNELKARQDAGVLMKERYLLLDPMNLALFHSIYVISFEVLISQPCFLSGMPLADKKELCAWLLYKDDLWQSDEDLANYHRRITYTLIGRIMQQGEYDPFLAEINTHSYLSTFLTNDYAWGDFSEELETLVKGHAEEFLND